MNSLNLFGFIYSDVKNLGLLKLSNKLFSTGGAGKKLL